MKSRFLLVFSFYIFSLVSYQALSEQNHFYVFSDKGLKLRISPSKIASSEVVSYGKKVRILPMENKVLFQENNLKGFWALVELEDKKRGYMFSGYLLPFPPPRLKRQVNPLKTYIQLANKKGSQLDLENIDHPKFNMKASFVKVIFKISSMQDAFVLGKRIYDMPENFLFPERSRKIFVKADVLDKGHEDWKIFELKIERDVRKNVKFFHYSEKNHLGVLHAFIEKKNNTEVVFSETFLDEKDEKVVQAAKKGTQKRATIDSRKENIKAR